MGPALEAAAAADAAAGGWHDSQLFSSGPEGDRDAALLAAGRVGTARPQKAAASRRKGLWRRGRVAERQPEVLVAVPTANVWDKTELLLHSLAAVSDPFQLLVGSAPRREQRGASPTSSQEGSSRAGHETPLNTYSCADRPTDEHQQALCKVIPEVNMKGRTARTPVPAERLLQLSASRCNLPLHKIQVDARAVRRIHCLRGNPKDWRPSSVRRRIMLCS